MHIGKLIKEVIDSKGLSTGAVLKLFAVSRTNYFNIIERESIQTDLLLRISVALDYDFFRHYSAKIPFAKSGVVLDDSGIQLVAKEFEAFVEKSKIIISKIE